jgi:hypothetical protein
MSTTTDDNSSKACGEEEEVIEIPAEEVAAACMRGLAIMALKNFKDGIKLFLTTKKKDGSPADWAPIFRELKVDDTGDFLRVVADLQHELALFTPQICLVPLGDMETVGGPVNPA